MIYHKIIKVSKTNNKFNNNNNKNTKNFQTFPKKKKNQKKSINYKINLTNKSAKNTIYKSTKLNNS